ncbi:MAG TPA: O-antigen ligase family protein [Candidatus Binataceae bacterium]|nr:O-antigen ligase family protein [Candidatus Binataceae bacterium]
MLIYYLLLMCERFHDYPHLNSQLFSAVFVPVTITKIVGVVAVVTAMMVPRPAAIGAERRPIALLFVAFGLWSLLGTLAFGAPLPAVSLSYLSSLALLMVATRRLVCTPDRARNVIRVSVLAAGLATAWCYKQHFVEGAARAWGVGLDPNYEALSMVMMIPLAVWMARADSGRFWRMVGAVAAVSLVGAAFLTQSRGGLVALAVVVVAAGSRMKGKPAARVALLLTFGVFIGVAPSGLWRRFENIRFSGPAANGDETAARARLELIAAGLAMVESHPLFGVGLDRFKAIAPRYDPRLRDLGTQYIAHNTYLQVAAETGLPGLILFLALMAAGFGNCRTAERDANDPALAGFAAALRLALLAYAIAGLFLTAEFVVWYWLLIFLSRNLCEGAALGRSLDPRELPAAAAPHEDAARPRAIRYA